MCEREQRGSSREWHDEAACAREDSERGATVEDGPRGPDSGPVGRRWWEEAEGPHGTMPLAPGGGADVWRARTCPDAERNFVRRREEEGS